MNENQLVPYDLDLAKIGSLEQQYLGVVIPAGDKAAYDMVMGGLRECREIRLACDAWHKERKEWIVKAGKHYDQEKRRVHSLLEPIEEHLKAVRQVEDDRIATIKQEKAQKEQERIAAIQLKITEMKDYPLRNIHNRDSNLIMALINQLNAIPIEANFFQEFTDDAQWEKDNSLKLLQRSFEERVLWEKQQAEVKAEAERQAKVKKEQEAEAARLKEEQDKIEAEKARLEAEKRQEQERKDREAFKSQAREVAKLEAEKDAKEKAEREAKEAEERKVKEEAERVRQEALKPDKEKLMDFFSALLGIEAPRVTSDEAHDIAEGAMSGIRKIAKTLYEKTEAL